MTKFFKFLLLFFFCQLSTSNLLTEEKKFWINDDQIKLVNEVIEILEEDHYTKKNYSSIKEDIVVSFIDRLDPSRSIFLEKEVNSFTSDFLNLQQNNQREAVDRALRIFDLYYLRYLKRYELQKELLTNIEGLNLNQNKKILKDRSESRREDSLEALNILWKDQLINDVIQLYLTGNNRNETKSKLIKRLDNQYNFFSQTKSIDILDLYINSITLSYGPHTSYMSPKRTEDFDIDMSLSLEGIGALLSNDGLYTTITSLVPGGPAQKSNKLKPNDKIVGVAQENEENVTDIIGWRIDDVVQLIRGPKNTNVTLEIIPASSLDESETKFIQITRNLVKLEDQAAEKRIITVKKPSADYKLGIIELPAFYMDLDAYQRREYNFRSSSNDVRNLIQSMKKTGIDGLILDLRNNGGGSLREATALSHLFLGAGTKVQVKSSNGNIHGLGERRGFQLYDGPLVVLVNRFSASASEILAGAIQDYGRGLVLGTDTFGKGTVQRVQRLSSGQLKFTESKFYRVSGKSTQNKGISPDIYLPSQISDNEFGENKLPKALEYDSIASTRVRNFNRINISKENLWKQHQQRLDQSILFNHYRNLKSWREEQLEEKFFELNVNNRRAKKEQIESELLAMENNLRKQLGLETFVDYQAFLNREENDEDPDIEEEILLEAANILSDFIEFSYQPVISMKKAG